MVRFFQIVVLSYVALIVTGCNEPEKNKALWQQVKISDIAPSHSGKELVSQALRTINFDIYIFETPVENVSVVNDIWQMLYTEPLQFNDRNAFSANSFLIGFGQSRIWSSARDLLLAADSKKVETVSILLSDGQTNDLHITKLKSKQTIFYISDDASMGGSTVGPGTLVLRIIAEKIPGSRGVCNFDAQPVFLPPLRSSIPQLTTDSKYGELLFTCYRFGLRMSPGDFVFLGPKEYLSHQVTLGSLFFSRPGRKPIVRSYLIVCARIND